MKKLIQSFLPIFILSSQVFAIAGFGLNLNKSMYSVAESTSLLTVENVEVATITQHEFENGVGIGGYLYIDAIPMVDLDIEGSLIISPYKFSFNNDALTSIDKQQFGWVDASGYITLQKKLLKLSIPFLAKAKLTAGAGVNSHSSTPMVDQKMMETVMGGAGNLESGTLDTDELIKYLKDNKVSSTGFHIQAGLQFKLLMLDSFLFYRQVIADDVIPGAKGFGSLNLRLGMGF
jgi:hypothetical protein